MGRGGAPAAPKMEAVNTSGTGKVTRAELAAYYRKHGFTPFQFDFGSGAQNRSRRMRRSLAVRGPSRPVRGGR